VENPARKTTGSRHTATENPTKTKDRVLWLDRTWLLGTAKKCTSIHKSKIHQLPTQERTAAGAYYRLWVLSDLGKGATSLVRTVTLVGWRFRPQKPLLETVFRSPNPLETSPYSIQESSLQLDYQWLTWKTQILGVGERR
jgi:hypothetical protein